MQFKFLNQLLRTTLLTGIVTIGLLALAPATQAAEGDTPPGVEVSSGTDSSLVVVAGEETQISVAANITHDPISNQECTLSGPDWTWSGSGATVESNDENATLTFTFDTAGDYTVGATAKATYSSNCSGDAGISGSGGISFAVKVVAKNWLTHTDVGKDVNSQGVAIDNGRMTAPQDQTKSPADPAQLFIPVGKEIGVGVEDATDNDKWTLDLNGDGQIDPNPDHGETGVESDTVKYKWSGGGDFDNEEVASTTWSASTPGSYTLTCTIDDDWEDGATGVGSHETGNRNDGHITRSFEVVVYSATLTIARSGTSNYGSSANVAAGAIATGAHQASLLVQVEPRRAGIPIPQATIFSGGRGPLKNSTVPTATVLLNIATGETVPKTDADGRIVGTFTSGHRTESTVIQIDLDDNPETTGGELTATVNQRWNELPKPDRWGYDPFFDYDTESTITYNLSYDDGNSEVHSYVPIDGHTFEFKTTGLSGYEWDSEAGEDKNEDGLPDGDYVPASYSGNDLDSSGWSDLVEWGEPTASANHYSCPQTIYFDEDFIVDWVEFNVYDQNAHKAE